MAVACVSITPLMGQVTAVSLGSLCISSLSVVLVLFLFFSQAHLNFPDSSSPPAFLPLSGPLNLNSSLPLASSLLTCFVYCSQNVKNREFVIGKELNYKLCFANTRASLTVTQEKRQLSIV